LVCRVVLGTLASLLAATQAADAKRATVTDIADGDTIEVRVGDRTEDVRLIGIDTPEIYFGAECGGTAASRSINRMLSVGDRVKAGPGPQPGQPRRLRSAAPLRRAPGARHRPRADPQRLGEALRL
jgi:endonuclease YncB( thermonuclease family)